MIHVRKSIAIFTVVIFYHINTAKAQEYSIGVHASNAMNVPIPLKTENAPNITSGALGVGIACGFDVQVTHKNWQWQLSPDYLIKETNLKVAVPALGQNQDKWIRQSIFQIRGMGNPLLYTHDKNAIYNLYMEIGLWAGMHQNEITINNNRSNDPETYMLYPSQLLYGGLLGFKVNAIWEGVGRLEYGLRYQFAAKKDGPYIIDIWNQQSQLQYHYYVIPQWMQVHLTFFLLNWRKGEGRIRYTHIK